MDKKIIHIITRLDKGGSADIVLKLSEEFKKKGYNVSILSGFTKDPVIGIDEFVKRTGIKIHTLSYLYRDISPFNDIKALFYITRYLLKEKPLIVHTHTSKAGFIGRVAAKLSGVKCIVYTTHGHIFYGYFTKLKTRFFIYLERFAAFFCDAITTLTEKEKKEFLHLKIAKEEKIFSIPNGIDITQFSKTRNGNLRKELGIEHIPTIIGWIGRFEYIKGPDIFVSVCRKLFKTVDSVSAIMIGDGSLFNDIKSKVLESGLERSLLLLGYRSDVINILKDIDILVLTSINEGQGMVILEAMAAGKPVVATNVGGVAEIVEHGSTGYLVNSRDIEEITRYLMELILDKEKMRVFGINGYNMAKKYSLSEMINRFESLYISILHRKDLSHCTGS